jgi:hypothetical protein
VGTIRIRAVLEPYGPAAAVLLTDEQVAEIGEGAKSPPVRITVDGRTVAGRIARRGGSALIGFSRATRADAAIEPGETYDFEIALDDAPREVDVPPALTAALDGDAAARQAFDGLAYTHRKEFARWVAEAKRDETRDRRVAETLRMLHAGETRS